MKSRVPALLLIAATVVSAQETAPERDLVPSGLRPLIVREPRKSNEVTVVLDPPTSEPMEAIPETPEQEPPGLIENLDSLPPAEGAPAKAPDIQSPPASLPAPPSTPKKKGLIVRVENLQTPDGPVNPADVKLLAPFLAKPLSTTPKGWKLETLTGAPPFNREVEIAPGSKVTLAIQPHVLIPDSDGATIFSVNEPGYESSLGYDQASTISAILSKSLSQMDGDSKQMGDAIDRLQQLLVSLPKPPAPEVSVENAPVAKPVTKPARK